VEGREVRVKGLWMLKCVGARAGRVSQVNPALRVSGEAAYARSPTGTLHVSCLVPVLFGLNVPQLTAPVCCA